MINNKRVLTIIPARGGSKEIPGKNIIKLGDKELIGYTIEAAINAGVSDKVIVDTDDAQIAEVAISFGAEVPYMRPDYLADDIVPPIDVVLNSFKWFKEQGDEYDIFIYLQPTSPFRNADIIKSGMKSFLDRKANLIASVNKSSCIPDRMKILDDDLRLDPFTQNKKVKLVRQLIGEYYELNGAMIIGYCDQLIKEKSWFLKDVFGFNLEYPYYIDIDTYADLDFAEYVLNKYKKKNENKK